MNKSWITLGEPQRSFYPQQKLKEFRKDLFLVNYKHRWDYLLRVSDSPVWHSHVGVCLCVYIYCSNTTNSSDVVVSLKANLIMHATSPTGFYTQHLVDDSHLRWHPLVKFK